MPVKSASGSLTWKMGFEIELLAPRGSSRQDLAEVVARAIGSPVERFFHPQAEHSKVPGTPTFENLTPGFRVGGADGAPFASFVDDLTIVHGLDRTAPPLPDWYRIVSDDARLLQLAIVNCDPLAPLSEVLEPLAALFGTSVDRHPSGMVKVGDLRNVTVSIGAPMPGERERPCEIVTAPLMAGHAEALGLMLGAALDLGFTLPREGATHIHFDAAPLRRADVIARLVRILSRHGTDLKLLLDTNPYCIRLGPWPRALLGKVTRKDFKALAWEQARMELKDIGLTKYCDFNLINMIGDNPSKQTFEVRTMPSYLEPEPILAAAFLFQSLLEWSVETAAARSVPDDLDGLLTAILPDRDTLAFWQKKWLSRQGGSA